MKDMLGVLIRRSFAAGRVRNIIAVLAIALTAVLFTSVTTIGMGAVQSITLTMQMQKGSRSDGDFRNMTQEQFEALRQADFIERAGLRMPVGFLENTKRHNIEFDVMDEIQADLTFCAPSHGSMPEAADEIVTSDLALIELGAEPQIGEEVTIEFTAHGEKYCLEMVVSGWYEATNDQLSMMLAGTAFRDAHPEVFAYTYDRDGATEGTYYSDFIAKSTVGLQEKMDAFSRSVGGNPDDMGAPNYLPGIVNEMTNQSFDLGIAAMGAGIAVLFIFCGYLLIYNIFDIAVMQEIRRYGLYRTIGMSRRQVKRLINCQAMWLSCVGIPLGLLIGFLIGRAALPVVMNVVSVEYENIAVEVTPSPVIFAGAALLTAFTVFLSTRKPVRAAADISPIEAFRYVESGTGKRTYRKSADKAGIPRLAWSNIGRGKRRSVFIMVSLMLCVVLLNSAGTAAGSLDVEKQVEYMIRTDFAVVNVDSTNGQKGFTTREQGLSGETMEAIAARPGVSGASAIYKNTREDVDVTYAFGITADDDFHVDEDTGLTQGAYIRDGDYYWFGLGTDGRPLCNVYGMEETALSRMDLREGETDAQALFQKMQEGAGVLVGVPVNRSDMSLYERLDFVEIGDVITVYRDGEPYIELPVLAKAAINGDDEEIGYTVNGPMEIGGDGIYLYLPAAIYEEIYEEPAVYKYSFNVEESEREAMTEFLENYIKTADNNINYLSAESARESEENTRTMIHFVGGLLGLIFGMAGVLNLINTIITTILTRRHEFATMQSIGMTGRQLTQMMVCEGVYYALGGCIMGLLGSAVLNVTLVKGLLASIRYFTFRFTLLPAIVTCGVLLLLAAVIPAVVLKLFHRGSIVEQLRVSE